MLGAGPYIDLASQAKIPHTQEKLGVAGALAGRPIELVRCETVDADVPADAEIGIEGHFVPKLREPEGPLGEVAGTYGLQLCRYLLRPPLAQDRVQLRPDGRVLVMLKAAWESAT